ncbi:DUF7342 family protein [Halegenticoccus tardaugens]|uniref:DUF7342 family protein n=1 Tax=Halegenticoccus tardaugens TaxID=2071624 RepID=UPI001E60EBE0|nr:hypothetical protein [Halegenticoccus tardaugens]
MTDDSTSDTNPPEAFTRPSQTRGERIRAAARTLRTPRTASWVATETEASVKTAQKYLDQLVEDNVLRKIEQGDQTLYCIDQLMATYREIASLQREHTREELTTALTSMRTKIMDWQETYDVERPGGLRASIAALTDQDEIERRHEIASEWEHLEARLPVVRAALNEYDWASERDALSA